jgi:hypothetical protein
MGPPVSSINKTDRHDIAEILLKVALKIGFDESQQKLMMNISFNLKIMETRKIGFDES